MNPPSLHFRWPWRAGLVLLGLAGLLRFGNTLAIAFESERPSHSTGTPTHGGLQHGKRLPSRGSNFRAYSDLGALMGRNAVHHRVRDTVLDAYAEVGRELPGARFVYGETGWPGGGRFEPHRTHENGMVVDFFVPVLDQHGRAQHVPTHAFNRYGYDLEFSPEGRLQDYRIDFEAMAAHLRALQSAGRRHGLDIRLVIFDKPLRERLFASRGGRDLRRHMTFSQREPWVRHDEHYHVVFVERG
jgi:penicillin-insensitive murein DD-endopeptidase